MSRPPGWQGFKLFYSRDLITQVTTACLLGFPCSSAGKESACNAGDLGSFPGLGRSPGEGKDPTSVFWLGELQGLYSPWGCKELDMTYPSYIYKMDKATLFILIWKDLQEVVNAKSKVQTSCLFYREKK